MTESKIMVVQNFDRILIDILTAYFLKDYGFLFQAALQSVGLEKAD